MVQKYLKKIREGGGVVTGKVAIAACAIIQTQNHTKFGGHIDLNQTWAYSLLMRHQQIGCRRFCKAERGIF